MADAAYPFVSTKLVAQRLPADARVIADTNYAAIGLLFWRRDITLRSRDGRGRYMRYNPPDRIWLEQVALDPLVHEECRIAPKRVFVVATADFSPTPLVSKCVDHRRSFVTPTRDVSEAFNVFAINCNCAL